MELIRALAECRPDVLLEVTQLGMCPRPEAGAQPSATGKPAIHQMMLPIAVSLIPLPGDS